MSDRAGSRFEIEALEYLRERGHIAERLARRGSKDEGDVVAWGPTANEPGASILYPGLPWTGILLEEKVRRHKTNQITLSEFMSEAVVEASHFGVARGFTSQSILPAVHLKRVRKSMGESFVVVRFGDLFGWPENTHPADP